MSLHKEPLSTLEQQGLERHGLPVGTPSQLADAFRLGVRWALQSSDTSANPPLTDVASVIRSTLAIKVDQPELPGSITFDDTELEDGLKG